MKNFWQLMRMPVLIFTGVLVVDQVIKIWIKTTFHYGETRKVLGDALQLHFIENNGMAFGMELGGDGGKIVLSLFRIFAVLGLGYLLYSWAKKKASKHLIVAMSLIVAGAAGNIIDSMVYGRIFSSTCGNPRHIENCREVAVFMPGEGGYAPVFKGEVVDMFYCELINIKKEDAPSWMPDFLFSDGDRFIFFRPVFNFADASISIGVFLILIFYRKIFNDPVMQDSSKKRITAEV